MLVFVKTSTMESRVFFRKRKRDKSSIAQKYLSILYIIIKVFSFDYYTRKPQLKLVKLC